MGPIGCPETSVINNQYSLRKNPEERSSRQLRGGRLKSREDHLIVLSIKQITWRRMTEWLVDNDLGRIEREAAVK